LDVSLVALRRACVLAVLALLAIAPSAQAAGEQETHLTPAHVAAIAKRDPKVIEETREYGHLTPSPTFRDGHWEVGFFRKDRELVLVIVDDTTRTVRESWTGYQVAWQMARGYAGAFGRKVNAPYVWLPLCGFFLLGLLDWRRLRRFAHLDLIVLLAFGVSHFFFNRGNIGVSVPLVYPVLAYLLARMLWIGLRGRGSGWRPSLPITWLAVGTVFLLAFRVALNLADANVIDVGYAGVIGADRVTHDKPLYGAGAFPDDNGSGDTYGPANYYAYVPFELALPWSGSWDDLPAAHGASVAFDLITVLGLFMLGRRIRPGPAGMRLGVILAYAWAAYPYTAFALESNSNDALVSALIVGALLLIGSPAGRAGMVAIAALTKFSPLALAPLFMTGVRDDPQPQRGQAPSGFARLRGSAALPARRPTAVFLAVFVAVTALLLAGPAVDPGLSTFWDRTISFQVGRDSPFSIWGQVASLDWLHTAVKVFAVGLAVGVAFVPRRRTLRQVAALGAAVMIAVELTADHWFYLYIPWFFPLLALALVLGDGDEPEPATRI
jgi:hypothetical protein